MTEINNINKKRSKTIDYKKFAKNSFFSFLNSYSGFFLSILTSFLIARLISQEVWGFLVITLSYIAFFQLFLNFLPPSLGLSYNYFIPKYQALNQNKTLKNFLINSIIIRISFTLIVYLVSLVVYLLFTHLFIASLNEYYPLFLILSPIIIINGINYILNDVDRAFNKFNVVFILSIVYYMVNIGGLIFILFIIKKVTVYLIALVILISYIIPFVINCFILIRIIFKIKIGEDVGQKLSKTFKKLYLYGFHLSVKTYLDGFYRQYRIISIGLFDTSEAALGFSISNNYNNVTFEAVNSFNRPLTISFSDLYAKKKFDKILKIYNVALRYSVFLILLITGLLYFTSNFFLFLVYGKSYLIYSVILKLMVIAISFNVLSPFFFSFLRTSSKIKYLIPISLVNTFIRLILFTIGVIFFGLYGAILLGIFLANLIVFILLIILNKKILNIQLKLFKLTLQYFSFFISLGLTLILENLFFADLNIYIISNLNLMFFKHINLISISFFVISFLFLNLIFNIFSKKDLDYFAAIFDRDARSHKIIRKITYLLSKLSFR
ncbi:MAG: lipopolysaccharide biosynthesis protein [Candidatus Thorarchaeota archaeon]